MKNYSSFISYFKQKTFGSELPVLTFLSALPPEDRCKIIENVLTYDVYNVEAYSKLSMAYLKNDEITKAFDLLKQANTKGYLNNDYYQIFKIKIEDLNKTYQGNFGSANSYLQTISILENRVDEKMKQEYLEFYNLVYFFAKDN